MLSNALLAKHSSFPGYISGCALEMSQLSPYTICPLRGSYQDREGQLERSSSGGQIPRQKEEGDEKKNEKEIKSKNKGGKQSC